MNYIGFGWTPDAENPLPVDALTIHDFVMHDTVYAIYSYENGNYILNKANSVTGSVRNNFTGTGVSYLYYFNYDHLRALLRSYIGTADQ